jgi:hypothetical protein
VTISIILAAAAVSGCCCCTSFPTSTNTSFSTTIPFGSTTEPTAVPTTGTASTTLSTLGSAIDLSKLNWYEYRVAVNSTGEDPIKMTLREDFNVDYKGSKANKTSMTLGDMDGSGTSMFYEFYVDGSGNSLGGHYKVMVNGNVMAEDDLPAGETSAGSTGFSTSSNPFVSESDASIKSTGAETVTVPAGTFACTKYTIETGDGSGTVWISSSAPIPVKYESKMTDTDFVMELTGWG